MASLKGGFFFFLPMFTHFSFIWLITQSLFFLISKMKTGKTMCRVWEEGISEERAYIWGVPSLTTRLRWPWIMSAVAVRSQRGKVSFPQRADAPCRTQVKCGCSLQREEKAGRCTGCHYSIWINVLFLNWKWFWTPSSCCWVTWWWQQWRVLIWHLLFMCGSFFGALLNDRVLNTNKMSQQTEGEKIFAFFTSIK